MEFAESGDRLAIAGVHRGQHAVHEEQEPPVAAVGALPVIHPAYADPAFVGLGPFLRARCGIERHQGVAALCQEQRIADLDRVELRRGAGTDLVRPGNLEVGDVALVDLSILQYHYMQLAQRAKRFYTYQGLDLQR